jgi:hypothetical protein
MWSGNNAGPTVTLTVDLAAFLGLTNNFQALESF